MMIRAMTRVPLSRTPYNGEILPEDIAEFSKMKGVKVASADEWMSVMSKLPEEKVKEAFAKLLSEYDYRNGEWLPVSAAMPSPVPLTFEADAMHGALRRRANALMGCTDGSEVEAELIAIVGLIEAYEAKRWPLGKEPGGKG